MKKIFILFSTSSTIGAKFLRWYQRIPYSHVEVYNQDTKEIIGARSTGVKIYNQAQEVNEFKTLEVTDEQYDRFYEFMYDKVGQKYDWAAYLGLIRNDKKYEESDKWFCSELVYAGLKHAGVEIFSDIGPWSITPRDLFINMQLKDPVYESPGNDESLSQRDEK
jgi:uncharacterized protein YycO